MQPLNRHKTISVTDTKGQRCSMHTYHHRDYAVTFGITTTDLDGPVCIYYNYRTKCSKQLDQ